MVTDPDTIEDAIVVGAGPAGLTAAIYLGRFRRRCLILEDGESRARWIPTSHNIPGFAAGIGGRKFLSSLKEQALKYGAQLRRASVTDITVDEDLFSLRTEQGSHRSRFVLLATGVKDHLPAIEGASEAILSAHCGNRRWRPRAAGGRFSKSLLRPGNPTSSGRAAS
jgi:thioredoxin reductase (NADPH)